MNRRVQIVRLMASVVVSLAACRFVVFYSGFSHIRFQFDHPDAGITWIPLTAFVTEHGGVMYAVPIGALFVGLLLIWRRPNWSATFEVPVSTIWVLSLIWAGLSLIAWQMQNIPVFSGMRLHYSTVRCLAGDGVGS